MSTPKSAPAAPRQAVIYTRVSNDKSGIGRSTEQQEQICRAVVEREGWSLVEVVEDRSIGASRFSGKVRPGFERLRDLLTTGRILIVWNQDRMTRQMSEFVAIRDLCRDRGVEIYDGSALRDLADSGDALMMGMNALFAEQYTEALSKNIRRSTDARASSGTPYRTLGFGWIEHNVDGVKSWELHPEESELIATATTDLLSGGVTVYGITKRWNASEITTRSGNPWTTARVRKILERASNAGLRVHRGEVQAVRGVWPTIITEAEHVRLAAYFGNRERPVQTSTAPTQLLTALAVCGAVVDGTVCGQKLRGETRARERRDGAGERVRRLRCPDGHVARNSEPIEAVVRAVVLEVIEALRIQIWYDEDPAVQEAHSHLLRANEIESDMNAYVEAYGAGELPLTLDQFRKGTTKFSERIAAERAQAANVTDDAALRAIMERPAEETWDGADLEVRRHIVRTLLDVVVSPGRGAVSVTGKPSTLRRPG